MVHGFRLKPAYLAAIGRERSAGRLQGGGESFQELHVSRAKSRRLRPFRDHLLFVAGNGQTLHASGADEKWRKNFSYAAVRRAGARPCAAWSHSTACPARRAPPPRPTVAPRGGEISNAACSSCTRHK